MAGLNPPQEHAVRTLSGPLLVLAGAGTGKTRVVTFRVANLIRHGIRPDRILAVTFTNKAAIEMRERIGHLIGSGKTSSRKQSHKSKTKTAAGPQIGTFHSHCVQVLKRHAKVLGYPEKFAIYDRGDQESVARSTLRDMRVGDASLKPAEFLGFVGRWKNSGITPANAQVHAKTDKEHLAASGFRRYQESLRLSGAMDFDDLLLNTEILLTQHEEIRKSEAGLYDHILVDEYQDTNGSQYRITRSLAIDHRNLCVVGDDDQSIYGWRGAEVQHILNFRNDWPEATVVRLEDNYRSTEAIIRSANTLIEFNKHRHDKTLRAARSGGKPPEILQFENEQDEAEKVVEEIRYRLRNDPSVEPGDFAILFRTNEQPRPFEVELRKAGLPYVLTGTQSFFDRKEVRDLLSYLRFIDTPSDEVALLRIINTPPRGLGAKSVEALLAQAVSTGTSVFEVFHDRDVVSRLPQAARVGIGELCELVRTCQADLNEGVLPNVVLQDLIASTGYRRELDRNYGDPEEREMRLGTIEELVNAVSDFESRVKKEPSLADFLNEIALSGREFGSPKEQKARANAISLMTYHSAKGLEFPICYMIGMEEGVLPHRRTIQDGDDVDEERRLCYVGITRAQNELFLSLPLSRKKWGKARETYPSRFLYEMTGQADNPNRLKAVAAASREIRGGNRVSASSAKPTDKKKSTGSSSKRTPGRKTHRRGNSRSSTRRSSSR